MKKKRALFVYTRISSFIKGDIEILEKIFRVTALKVDNSSKSIQLIALTKEFFYLIFNLLKYDVVFIWFADYHSFLPVLFSKLFRKKVYIVIGGYDVCRVRNLGYGSFSNPVRGFMTLYSIKNATLNLCVSEYIGRVVRAIAPQSKRIIIYNGIALSDNQKENFEDSVAKKERMVLSVALSSTTQSFFIKGIDRFIAVARAIPQIQFVIVGVDSTKLIHLLGSVPDNLSIIPKVEHKALKEYYQKAAVYCQLSRKESFSLSLAEAMYFNCVPVISNSGGMIEVTGGMGKTVSGDNADETASAIISAMETGSSPLFRKRVEEKFTVQIRNEALKNILLNR